MSISLSWKNLICTPVCIFSPQTPNPALLHPHPLATPVCSQGLWAHSSSTCWPIEVTSRFRVASPGPFLLPAFRAEDGTGGCDREAQTRVVRGSAHAGTTLAGATLGRLTLQLSVCGHTEAQVICRWPHQGPGYLLSVRGHIESQVICYL